MNGTEVTSSPESSGSIYMGDGRYAEVKEVELLLEASRYRDSNQIEFPVTVQASTVNQSEGTQETVYVQEHWLELEIEPSLVPEERDETPDTSFWEGVTGQESEESEDSEEETDQEDSEEEEEFNTEQDETETRDENQVQQNESQTEQGLEDSEESQVDTVTYVLLFGLLLSLTYLYRVA